MRVELRNRTVNKNEVTIETSKASLRIFFSYKTPICFVLRTSKDYINMTRKNDWSVTTGKFLNELQPDKNKRVSGEVFEKALEKALKEVLKK